MTAAQTEASPAQSDAPSEAQPQVFTPRERRLTLAGVMLVFMLSALDQTIVSTAMPRIVAQLQGLHLYAWVTTAYMLSSTVMVPIYGKLNDIFGRKPILVVGIGIFMTGSALCGLAGEFGRLPLLGGGMTQLIVFRGLQGLGGGALFTSAFAIIADLYPPRERAKFAGMFGAVFALASIIGPVLGGFFTDMGATSLLGLEIAGWRWIFYVNLPLSAFALFVILAWMPVLTHRAPGRIDFAGAGLIIVTFVPLLLALSWGGRDYAWTSPVVLGLLAVSALGLAAFLWVESVVINPILTLTLFHNRVFSTANAANFMTSMAFMGSLTFMPLYMQLGLGVPATTSGLAMMPMMLGMVASSSICGQIITRTGHYRPVLVAGAALMTTGLFLLSRLGPDSAIHDVTWRVLLMGIGLGPSMGTFNIVIQNAVERTQIGVATSSTQFFRQIGGTVGVALFAAVLTHNLAVETSRLPPQPSGAARTLDLSDLQGMAAGEAGPPQPQGRAPVTVAVDPEVRGVVARSVARLFLTAVGVAFAAFLLVSMIPVLPLHRRTPPGPEKPAA